jgi:hypothetical protein
MTTSRSGHHGSVAYVFENNGYDSSPNDTTFKVFGGSTRLTTFDAAQQAARVFNADRTTAEIISQNFDGGWEITCDGFAEPPWWLAGILGQPTSTNISGSLYDYDYDLDNNNDPVPLRFYLPTDGFNDYAVIPGAVIVDAQINQTDDASPEVTLNGFYASEPSTESSLSPAVPDFGETSFSNRDAELLVDTDSVGAPQDTTVEIATGARDIRGFGSGDVIDFVPGTWEPSVTWSKIIATDQTVDPLSRFQGGSQVNVSLDWDNGLTGGDEYSIDVDATGSFPNEWSESGRNNPEENLVEEISEMCKDVDVTVTTDAGSSGNPPGITL